MSGTHRPPGVRAAGSRRPSQQGDRQHQVVVPPLPPVLQRFLASEWDFPEVRHLHPQSPASGSPPATFSRRSARRPPGANQLAGHVQPRSAARSASWPAVTRTGSAGPRDGLPKSAGNARPTAVRRRPAGAGRAPPGGHRRPRPRSGGRASRRPAVQVADAVGVVSGAPRCVRPRTGRCSPGPARGPGRGRSGERPGRPSSLTPGTAAARRRSGRPGCRRRRRRRRSVSSKLHRYSWRYQRSPRPAAPPPGSRRDARALLGGDPDALPVARPVPLVVEPARACRTAWTGPPAGPGRRPAWAGRRSTGRRHAGRLVDDQTATPLIAADVLFSSPGRETTRLPLASSSRSGALGGHAGGPAQGVEQVEHLAEQLAGLPQRRAEQQHRGAAAAGRLRRARRGGRPVDLPACRSRAAASARRPSGAGSCLPGVGRHPGQRPSAGPGRHAAVLAGSCRWRAGRQRLQRGPASAAVLALATGSTGSAFAFPAPAMMPMRESTTPGNLVWAAPVVTRTPSLADNRVAPPGPQPLLQLGRLAELQRRAPAPPGPPPAAPPRGPLPSAAPATS